jgi:iron complex transport system substrate-binding protein
MKKNKTIILSFALIFFVACTATNSNVETEPTNVLENVEIIENNNVQNDIPEATIVPKILPITFIDDSGLEMVFDAIPSSIISISASITESLFAIGAGELIVGIDDFSLFPAEVANIEVVGSFYGDLPLEKMISLEADLVIAAETISLDQVEAMREVGLMVFWQKNPLDFDGLYENLIELGEITGFENTTELFVSDLQDRVNVVNMALKNNEDIPVVFYELDATDVGNPWTTGSGTFVSTIIEMAGGQNMGDIIEGSWVQISTEAIIINNPDVILLADAEWGVTVESVTERIGWDVMSAIQNASIFPVDSNLFSIPGPRLVEGLETLANILHPELFE